MTQGIHEFEYDDAVVDLLAWWLTHTDPLIDAGEVQRRTHVARKMTESHSEQALLILSGMLAALVSRLPQDDLWLTAAEQKYNFLDVDLNLENLPPLIFTLLVSDSLALDADARQLIHLAKMGGWRLVHQYMERLPANLLFDVASVALRHALRRGRMYVDDPRLYTVFAFLGAAERLNQAALDRHIYLVKIPMGLYPALMLPGANIDPLI